MRGDREQRLRGGEGVEFGSPIRFRQLRDLSSRANLI